MVVQSIRIVARDPSSTAQREIPCSSHFCVELECPQRGRSISKCGVLGSTFWVLGARFQMPHVNAVRPFVSSACLRQHQRWHIYVWCVAWFFVPMVQ